MRPTIGIFTTVGNEKYGPDERGDAWEEAIASYEALADEVIIISGNKDFSYNKGKTKTIFLNWPWDFDWIELPRHMNLGLESLNTEFVFRCDIDYYFHEDDISNIRNTLGDLRGFPVLNMQKYVFIAKDKYYQKGPAGIIINKGLVGNNYKFGQATNIHTDLCFPIRVAGENDKGIPLGIYQKLAFGRTRLPFYVYDYSFKTRGRTKEEFWRFSQAYHKFYGSWSWGKTKEESFYIFTEMMKGRYKKCLYKVGSLNSIRKHPVYIEDRIKNCRKEEFYYDGWGMFDNSNNGSKE